MKRKNFILLIVVALAFLLTGCNSFDYKKAAEAFDNGNYQEAINLFEALGAYKDSEERTIESKYKYAEKLVERGKYQESIDLFNQIIDYKDSSSKIVFAEKQLMHQTYKDVYAKLTSGLWFFEAKISNAVNTVTFTEEKATLKKIYYDGNGPHSTVMDFDYTVDDKEITILTNKSNNITNEKEIKIQYDFSEDTFSLKGNYLTSEQVEKGLEGYWGLRDYSDLTGCVFEYICYFKDGYVKYESANEAYGYNDGTYYYFGPYEGTYAVTEKGLEVDAHNGFLEFGFVISKGKVYLCRYGKIMSDKNYGFKGKNGFTFY